MQSHDAGKGFKSEMDKRVKEELLKLWTGTDMLYNLIGEFNAEVSSDMLNGVFLPASNHLIPLCNKVVLLAKQSFCSMS